jgi:hypothetical protein
MCGRPHSIGRSEILGLHGRIAPSSTRIPTGRNNPVSESTMPDKIKDSMRD